MVWNCKNSNDVWANDSLSMHKWLRYMEDFGKLWELYTKRLNTNDLELVAIIMRSLWLWKNEVVFRNKCKESQLVIETSKHELDEFHLANFEDEPQLLQQTSLIPKNLIWWKLPTKGATKINWDSSFSTMIQIMGIRILAKDDTGRSGHVYACPVLSFLSPIVVECWDLLRALDFCVELNLLSAELKGDAEVIINALKNKDECLVSYGDLIEEAKCKLSSHS